MIAAFSLLIGFILCLIGTFFLTVFYPTWTDDLEDDPSLFITAYGLTILLWPLLIILALVGGILYLPYLLGKMVHNMVDKTEDK